jgi:ferritin-like protein
MDGTRQIARGSGSTRAQWLRRMVGGGAILAGGAAIGAHGGNGTSLAAGSEADAKILNLFLTLEYVQESFYGQAVQKAGLRGELLAFATAVGRQETAHVGFLRRSLGSLAAAKPASDFEAVLGTPERFRDAAVELEEAVIAAYVGQAPSLPRDIVAPIATLVSVEARQVAWVRDIAGISPAPRAADAARPAEDVLAQLRRRGFIR